MLVSIIAFAFPTRRSPSVSSSIVCTAGCPPFMMDAMRRGVDGGISLYSKKTATDGFMYNHFYIPDHKHFPPLSFKKKNNLRHKRQVFLCGYVVREYHSILLIDSHPRNKKGNIHLLGLVSVLYKSSWLSFTSSLPIFFS